MLPSIVFDGGLLIVGAKPDRGIVKAENRET
jgi:hypothetical protein